VPEATLSHEILIDSYKPSSEAVNNLYCDRRTALEEGWEEIRNATPKTYMESCEPGHIC